MKRVHSQGSLNEAYIPPHIEYCAIYFSISTFSEADPETARCDADDDDISLLSSTDLTTDIPGTFPILATQQCPATHANSKYQTRNPTHHPQTPVLFPRRYSLSKYHRASTSGTGGHRRKQRIAVILRGSKPLSRRRGWIEMERRAI